MKVFRYIEKYLVYASPAVLICILWSQLTEEKDIAMPLKIVWEILSWNLLLWFALLTFFVVSLLFVESVRENFFKKVASIKERDEREEQIVGIVTKRTFISTLSLLVFLFFISAFSFNLRKLPPGEAINGKTGTASISFQMKLFDEPKEKVESDGVTVIQSKDIPFSKSALLLLLILWQLVAYRIFFWRETKLA